MFNFQFANLKMRGVRLGLLGRHQVENASLALAAVAILGGASEEMGAGYTNGLFSLRHPRGGLTEKKGRVNEAKIVSLRHPRGCPSEKNGAQVNLGKYEKIVGKYEKIIRKALSSARFAGRLEIFKVGEREVVLDGAHNPQKMRALAASLRQIFPGERFTFLVAFSRAKDVESMIECMLPLARKVMVTSFLVKRQDIVRVSQSPTKIMQVLKRFRFADCEAIADPKEAFDKVLLENKGEKVVVAGSLYLAGKLRPVIGRISVRAGG